MAPPEWRHCVGCRSASRAYELTILRGQRKNALSEGIEIYICRWIEAGPLSLRPLTRRREAARSGRLRSEVLQGGVPKGGVPISRLEGAERSTRGSHRAAVAVPASSKPSA